MHHARQITNRRRGRAQPHQPTPSGSGRPVVLQVLPSLVSGGVEHSTVETALALRSAGSTVLVASAGGPMESQLRRAGIRHVTLPLRSKNPLILWRNIARLQTIIEEHQVDIVHAHSRAPAWSAWAAARRAGCHFVTTFHAEYGHKSPAKRWYNSIMAKGDLVIAVSDYIARHVADTYEINPYRLRTIPGSVDMARFQPGHVGNRRVKTLIQDWSVPTDMPVILLPGRLTRLKGQRLLIEAIARLNRDDLTVLLVGGSNGKDNYRRELERLIDQYGLGWTVRLVGPCDDMPAAFRISDLVICPSLVPEGFGRTVAEAMAMGKPVIVSDRGAPPELVAHGESGWVVPTDDAEALADAIARALALPRHVLTEMGRHGMATIQNGFTKDHMCNATLALYDELLVSTLYDHDPLPEHLYQD